MRVLVTGSSGFIGQALGRVLDRRGHKMVPFDHPVDVRDRAVVADAVRQVGAVINLAGVLGTAETFDAEHAAAEVNILGAVNVFDAAAAAGVPVVQIGTGHKGQPNPYAITKGCAEDLALARARFGGERIVVVRAFHAYGRGQKSCAPHGPGRIRKIVPSMVCRALTGMPVEVYGSGEQLVDLVHVDEVAQVLADGLRAEPGSVLEAGTGKPTSVLDTARMIIEACGSSSRIEHVPMRRGEPEGTSVVAGSPLCGNPWPWRLQETVDHYRDVLS